MSTSTQPVPSSGVTSDEALSGHSAKEIVASSGLPAKASELILHIVKRTRLSRREKAGVAVELIAHFGDGLDAGASVDDLLDAFGDEATFARLVRRAKLRCRSWPRRAMRRTCQAIVVLLIFYAGAIVYYATGSPHIAVDYVAKLNEDLAAPENDRAWPIYRGALLKLDRERFETLGEAVDSPESPEWKEAAAFVRENEATFATMRRAAAMPHLGAVLATKILEEDRELWPDDSTYSWWRPPGEWSEFESMDTATWHIQIPYAEPLLAVARLLAIDTAEAARTGDGDRVLANLNAMLGLSRQFHRRATLIEQLVGLAISGQAFDVTGRVLRDHCDALSDAHLRELAHRFAGEAVVPAATLRGERYGIYDMTQRMYTKGGRWTVDGIKMLRIIEDDFRGKASSTETAVVAAPFYNGLFPSREDLIETFDRIYDQFEAGFRLPYWERQGKGDPFGEWVRSLSAIDHFKFTLVRKLIPALGGVSTTQQGAVGRRDGLLVALALEMHRRHHGRYPESLDELSPKLLPSVPRDRITGAAMRYRVSADQAVVYSVGQDRDDDGGVIAENIPIRFHKVPEGADEKTIERYRKHNEKLRNETPREHRQRMIKATGPSGSTGKNAHDGDWVLWRSAAWPVEREFSRSVPTE